MSASMNNFIAMQYFYQFPISAYDEQSIEDESHIATAVHADKIWKWLPLR